MFDGLGFVLWVFVEQFSAPTSWAVSVVNYNKWIHQLQSAQSGLLARRWAVNLFAVKGLSKGLNTCNSAAFVTRDQQHFTNSAVRGRSDNLSVPCHKSVDKNI